MEHINFQWHDQYKIFDSNLLKIDKKWCQSIDIYYIRYITMKDNERYYINMDDKTTYYQRNR